MKMHHFGYSSFKAALLLGSVATLAAAPAAAQQIASDWAPFDDSAAAYPQSGSGGDAPMRSRGGDRPQIDVSPYIEVQQVVYADLDGGNTGSEILTYTTVAAGIDASISTRRAEGQVSLRYERRIGYGNSVEDADTYSGLARGSVAIARGLSFEAGGLATRTHVDGRGDGATTFSPFSDNVTQVYSVYAGPTFSSQVGDLAVNAAYRAGYSKMENREVGPLPAGQQPFDQFDSSISQVAAVSVGMQPGTLPVGWSVGAGWNREDASQLDSRLDSKYVRGDVTVPITSSFAVVGGVGYEKIRATERDVVRNSITGQPVVGANGRLTTNTASPRLLAYESDGIIWDAGVMWRPSNRTSFTATYGKRYGTDSYTGSLTWAPDERTAVNVSVYDTVSGFGQMLNDTLARTPTHFRNSRNAISGDLNSCSFGQGGGFCLNNALHTASSATFRSRGVAAAISNSVGGWESGLAIGYDRRKFLAAGLGGQPQISNMIDENYWLSGSLGRTLGGAARFDTNVYAQLDDPGFVGAPNSYGIGANANYTRQIWRGLSASAGVGIDSTKTEDTEQDVNASALLGLRYTF